jgi:hypothetical protein
MCDNNKTHLYREVEDTATQQPIFFTGDFDIDDDEEQFFETETNCDKEPLIFQLRYRTRYVI